MTTYPNLIRLYKGCEANIPSIGIALSAERLDWRLSSQHLIGRDTYEPPTSSVKVAYRNNGMLNYLI